MSKRFWLRGMASIAYGRADVSIEVNEWLKPAGEYFKAKRNVAVMNGVRVGVARRKRPSADRFQILYVGLLCPEKGVSEMIEMVAALKECGRECELRCVGGWISEEYRESVTEKVEDLGVGECVVWAGVLHGDEKWQAYADADCFIFPSHHPTETFGLVLVEAMAFGLPVVTTKWRGIPTVVGDSGCAELCEVRRPDEWAEAVRRIMGDDSRRKEMGELARTRFESDFTEAKFLKRMDSVFQSLLDR